MNIIYIIASVLSIVLYISSVQFKDKKNILFFQFFSSICYVIVYAIKGAWSGCSIKCVDSIKNLAFIKKGDKIPIYFLIIFLLLLITLSVIFYDGIYSLIPLFINILMFVSTYMKNPKYIRVVMMITGIMWGGYNFFAKAYILLIGNVLEFISGLVATFRYRKIDNNN